ncbi:MAG: hypothetical protein HKL84_02420 [Acidimicrobiaceae bacterium]|nr:hypothetical protein [Acidimicrobiaceae bacterium]
MQSELWSDWRYFGFSTDIEGTTVEADQLQRNRAVIKLAIQDIKVLVLVAHPVGDLLRANEA